MSYYDDDNPRLPRAKLATDRNIWKLLLLTIVTLGVYNLIFFMSVTFDLNKVIGRHDGDKTWNYALAWVFSLFTGTIVTLVWHYSVAVRIERELARREIEYTFGTNTFWLWQVVGSLFIVGPYVYWAKLCHAMNLLCESYNNEPETDER